MIILLREIYMYNLYFLPNFFFEYLSLKRRRWRWFRGGRRARRWPWRARGGEADGGQRRRHGGGMAKRWAPCCPSSSSSSSPPLAGVEGQGGGMVRQLPRRGSIGRAVAKQDGAASVAGARACRDGGDGKDDRSGHRGARGERDQGWRERRRTARTWRSDTRWERRRTARTLLAWCPLANYHVYEVFSPKSKFGRCPTDTTTKSKCPIAKFVLTKYQKVA